MTTRKTKSAENAALSAMVEALPLNAVAPAAIVSPSPAARMLALIEKSAGDPRTNTEKMRAMLDMQLELIREERRIAYNAAMKACQEEMQPIVRKADNEGKKYSKLEHVDNALRPIYSKHGFSLSFNSRREVDGTITMLCDVLHDSGHHEVKELNGALDLAGIKGNANKTQVQGVGSTVSYLRRYLTAMIFNVVFINEDDDGKGGKKDPAQDPFKARAAADARTPEQKRSEAADELILRMHEMKTLDKRGSALMKNIKLITSLEEANDPRGAEIRKLAEEDPNVAA